MSITGSHALARFTRNIAAVASALVIAALALVAAFGPSLAPFGPLEQDLFNNFSGPTLKHPLGTDDLGRDTLSRLIYAGRVSLGISLTSVSIGLMVGTCLGLAAAYYRGWLDSLIMRLMDVLLSLPGMLLAVSIVALLQKGIPSTILAVAIYSVPTFARIVRGSALGILQLDYIGAARVMGASDLRILFRHVLPNFLSPLIVRATLELGSAILIASGLSFLGLGVQPPHPEWGAMLSKGRELVRATPVVAIAPGVAVTLAVLSFSLLGDGLRNALDPRLDRR